VTDIALHAGQGLQLRDAAPGDFDAILGINHASVHFLSAMDRQRLADLHGMATRHRVVEDEQGVCAFLLAMREGCAYDSPNYRWFAGRFAQFLYIDRVVIAPDRQGRGLGRLLYDDLLSFARATGIAMVTCEVDDDPPNAASQRFHAAFGFRSIGSQRLGVAGKRVAYLALTVGADPGG